MVTTDATNADALECRRWFVARREIGGAESGSAETIRDLARALPGGGWDRLDRVDVSVAVPLFEDGEDIVADGRFSVALPTEVCTGLPVFVNATFYATIARDDIDFGIPLNEFLLARAYELLGTAIEALKTQTELPARRAVTCAMCRSAGPLERLVFDETTGLAHQAVVLSARGTFERAADVVLFDDRTRRILANAGVGSAELEERDVVAVEDGLSLKAATTIGALPGARGSGEINSILLRRTDARDASLLEEVARHLRRSGTKEAWREFLDWVLERGRFSDEMEKQRWLPVGDASLVTPEDRPFLLPVDAKTDEDEVSGIAEKLAKRLRFVDEACVDVRTGRGRELTPMARALDTRGYVRSPRVLDVVKDVLLPSQVAAAQNGEEQFAYEVLAEMARLAESARPATRSSIQEFLARALLPNSDGAWIAAATAYFGSGWLDDEEREALLATAFPQRLLRSWPDFSAATGDTDCGRWRGALRDFFGVCERPRLWRVDRASEPVLKATYRGSEILGRPNSPFGSSTDKPWRSYLTSLERTKLGVTSGRQHVVLAGHVDGAETTDENRLAAVIDLILRDTRLAEEGTAEIRATRGGGGARVEDFWVWLIKSRNAAVFHRADGARASARDLWAIHARDLELPRYQRLPRLASVAAPRHFLHQLGVRVVEHASPEELVGWLRELASTLTEISASDVQSVQELCIDLWSALARRLDHDRRSTLPLLTEGELPVLVDGALVPVRVERLCIDDAPARRDLVLRDRSAPLVAVRPGIDASELFRHFQVLLGADSVLLTSKAPFDLAFDETAREPIWDFLVQRELTRHIEGLGIVLCGARGLEPRTQAFADRWSWLERGFAVLGRFDSSRGATGPVFDEAFGGVPALLVPVDADPSLVLRALYQAVDPGLADTWAAYCEAVTRGDEGTLIRNRWPLLDRELISRTVRRAAHGRRQHLRCAVLAISISRDTPRAVAEEAWSAFERGEDDALRALDIADLDQQLRESAELDHEQGSLALLRCAGTSVSLWQEERRRAGDVRYVFASTSARFRRVHSNAARALRVFTNKKYLPELREEAEAALQRFVGLEEKESLHDIDPADATTLDAAIQRYLIEAVAGEREVTDWARDLADFFRNETNRRMWSRREVGAFEEATRVADAQARVGEVLTVAGALAERHGVPLSTEGARADPLVACALSEVWGNRFFATRALEAWFTAVYGSDSSLYLMLKESGAFGPHDLSETEMREELAKRGHLVRPPPAAAPPDPEIQLFGQSRASSEILADLAAGPGGTIGQQTA